ncbi:4Fe-4S dicluster domain-containing protein [Heliobacillus mobilis]|uniref:4Fe-4S dicluster domain-containing protein n=1 Tax=Heliobacterium mobile TaxID=28064 RepID=A0A6I3SRD4_HELMO|nr:4Fe-4S binding protein [Heliobacterium mobile]MTV50932.1 4Fe-4S dicluster domain-containing protein [Heliobacterium mobile]
MEEKEPRLYRIEKNCIGCRFCVDICSWDALEGRGRERSSFKIDEKLCPGCGICADCCPVGAIQKVKDE